MINFIDEEIIGLVDFFQKIKIKFQNTNTQFIFLSKRFLELYCILENKYPKIQLPNYRLKEQDNYNKKETIIYLNDINYELPKKKIGTKQIVFTYIFTERVRLPSVTFKHIPNVTEDDIKKANNTKLFFPYHLQNKLKCHVLHAETEILDFIAQEITFLTENNVSDTLNLVPDFLKNYFTFYANNREQLEYFLNNFYNRLIFDTNGTDEERIQLKITLAEEIVNKFGIENISSDFKKWLIESNTVNSPLQHSPIKICNDKEILEETQNEQINKKFDSFLINKNCKSSLLNYEEILALERFEKKLKRILKKN